MKKLYMLSIAALLMAGCAEDITNNPKVGNFLSFSVTEESGGRSTTRSGFSDAIDGQNGSGFVPQNSLFTKESNTGISPTMRIDSLESDYDEPLCMIVTTEPIGQRGSTRGTEVSTAGLNADGKSIQVRSTLYTGLANYSTTSEKFEPTTATSWNGDASTSIAFSAWHPVTSGLSTYGLSVDGTTFTYTLPTTSEYQTDLIGTQESHSYSEKNNGNVPLTFKHLLAPVKFELAAGLKGTITSIKFSSIVKAGTHILGTTNDTYGQVWTATSTGEYTAAVSGTGTSGSAVQVDGTHYFMMIPQTVAEGVVMTITITDLAGTSNTLTYTVPSGGQVWKAGVVTTYTISTTAITSFTVTYPQWTDASTAAAVNGPITSYDTSDYFGLFAVDKAGKIVIANAQIKVTTAGATATCNLADAANSGQFTNVIPSQNYTYYLMYPYVSNITTTYPAIARGATAPGSGSGTADTFFANVVAGWTPSTTQNTQALFKAQDLQVAKYSSGFAMAHRMGLAGLTMGTNASAVTTITYDGNTSTELYRSTGTTSTTSLALFDNFSPLNSSSTYYYIVKHLTAYTLNSGYKVTTTSGDPVYQWSQAITNSQIDKGNYKAFSPTPAFRNFARRYSYTGTSQTFTPIIACLHKMECWGASGCDITSELARGGKGGYTYGLLTLTTANSMYVYVGGRPLGANASGDPIYITESDYPNWTWALYGSWRSYTSTKSWARQLLPGWNGGGEGTSAVDMNGPQTGGGGGGATDIRIVSGDWNNFSSLKSRIMVAAGGGGSSGGKSGGGAISISADAMVGYGGAGGGIEGYNGEDNVSTRGVKYCGTGATQAEGGNLGSTNTDEYVITESDLTGTRTYNSTTKQWDVTKTTEYNEREGKVTIFDSNLNKGKYGVGATNLGYGAWLGGGGGGGGWYGGGAANRAHGGGGGGSSFIAGMSGCKAVNQSATEPNYTTNPGASVSMRNDAVTTINGTTYTFTSAYMIDGKGYKWTSATVGAQTAMPNPRTASSTYGSGEGHTGNGYARITCMPYGN